MSGNAELSADGRTLAVRVPMAVARRCGRKVIVALGDSGSPGSRTRIDNTLVKALARAFYWRKLVEIGVHATVAELASAERVSPSYISRTLRLTLLAPHIVEAILDGRQAPIVTMAGLMRSIAPRWDAQR